MEPGHSKAQPPSLCPDTIPVAAARRVKRCRAEAATGDLTGLTSCPGCGLLLSAVDGPTHSYIGASAACWALYGQVLAIEAGTYRQPAWHRLTVDAYAPPPSGRLTVRDLLGAADRDDHERRSWAWAGEQWSSWRAHHAQIRLWTDDALR